MYPTLLERTIPPNIRSPRGLQPQQLKLMQSCLRLQHRPSHLSLFLMFLMTSFSFQLPPAPIADASMRLPLLAVQVTQTLQDVTNSTPSPSPTAAEGSVRLSPLATQAYTFQAFSPVSNDLFFFSFASSFHSRH